MSKRISVIIPTFNRAQVLRRALDSVLNQSLAPDEVIVVDDGSTDETAQLLSSHYPRVNYLYQPNQGVSSARNHGVQEATGNWLAFLDSDDEWLPGKLKQQMTALQQRPQYRLCHTDEIWIRNGRRVNPMHKHAKAGGHIFTNCLPICAISPSSVVMARDLFGEKGGFDEQLPACEDYDLWLRVCATEPVLFLEQPLLRKYGGHSDQLSKKHWGMDRFRIAALEKILSSGSLDAQQSDAALETLLSKCRILANGALKRGKPERAEHYQPLIARYSTSLSAGDGL